MARFSLSSLTLSLQWFVAFIGLMLLSGCATTPNFSALEDDELYLKRGEEFVTDAMYLAFALEQSSEETIEDDYYDPSRSQYSPGYAGGYYGMPGYQSSFNNPFRPFGNGFGTNWGLSSYLNPFGAGGLGFGYGMGGYDPFSSWGNPYGSMGYGYNPYGWNNGWNNGYGYTNWNNGGNINYGGWTGTGTTDQLGGVTGRTRTPIMSYTNNGSNYDANGVLVRPKVDTPSNENMTEEIPRTEEAPTYVSPKNSSPVQRWIENSGNSNRNTWSSPDNSSRSRSNGTNAPSWNSGNSRSGGSIGGSSGGNSRSSGSSSSRSSRGGGR